MVWWSSVANGNGTSSAGMARADISASDVAPARDTMASAAAMASPIWSV